MKKEGQITLFIILGLFIIAIFGFVSYSKSLVVENNNGFVDSVAEVKIYVDACIENALKMALDEGNICQIPQLEYYFENHLKTCTNGFGSFKGIEVIEGIPNSDIRLTDKKEAIVVNVSYPLEIKKDKTVSKISEFYLDYKFPIKRTIINDLGEELVDSNLPFSKPDIAIDGLGQPHIAVKTGLGKFNLYDKINGIWQPGVSINNSQYWPSAQSLDLPDIEIDTLNDVAYVTGFMVTAGDYNSVGTSTTVRPRISQANAPVYWSRNIIVQDCPPGWDSGVYVDVEKPGEIIISASGGWWKRFVYNESATGRITEVDKGQIALSRSGEKYAYAVSNEGMLHGVSNSGAQFGSSSYQNSQRQGQGLGFVVWADYPSYPQQMEEKAYPYVCADSEISGAAYILSDFQATNPAPPLLSGPRLGIVANIWDGTSLVKPLNDIFYIDPQGTSGSSGFPPKCSSADGGGAFVCWMSNGRIKIRYINPEGECFFGSIRDIGPGSQCGITTDSDGNLHVAYVNNGLRYKKIITE